MHGQQIAAHGVAALALRSPQKPALASLNAFDALGGDIAVRDAQDLMAFPFFSLAKSKRVQPIDFHAGSVSIHVEGTCEHGLATIWDADVLIWAASQLVEARDTRVPTSRLLRASPYQVLSFIGRGSSARDYLRLKAALDRLQSTSVATSIRQARVARLHRFSWISEWKERVEMQRPVGIELILADWFYDGVLQDARVLSIDRAYFALQGGIERWLYRLVRKHGGRQHKGWRFDFRHLHLKSGSLARYADFAVDLRRIAFRQALPGYVLSLAVDVDGREVLAFEPVPYRERRSVRTFSEAVDKL